MSKEEDLLLALSLKETPNIDGIAAQTSIEHLPPELIRHLFSFLDGLSLVRISILTKQFMAIASELWKPICERELGEAIFDVASGIYKGLHRPNQFHHCCVPWEKIFASVVMWRSLKRWEVEVFSSSKFAYDCIMCFGVAGDDVIIGTKSGVVGVQNVLNKAFAPVSIQKIHESAVNSLIVQTSSDDDYPDSILKYRIITVSKTRCLNVTDVQGNVMESTIKGERVVGFRDSIYSWSEMSNYIYELSLDMQSDTVTGTTLKIQLPSPSRVGRVLTVDPYQKYIITHFNGPMFWDEISGHWEDLCKIDKIRVFRGYIFSEGVTVSISTDFSMIITMDNDEAHIKWPITMKPTSALLHGHTFIVGTESGHVILYYLSSRKDLVNILPNHFDRRFDTNQPESILYLGVSEANENHKYPDIFAASRYQIFCFRTVGLKMIS